MSSITLNGDTSGAILLQAPAIAGSGTLTLPTGTATLGIQGPAFSAYRSSSQSMTSGTNTKVQFDTELFDTANCYDNTTNYRFTPNVAGYYQINLKVQTGGSSPSDIFCAIQKNGGTEIYRGNRGTSGVISTNISALIYMNGSTDYVEGYLYQTTTGIAGNAMSSGDQSWFNGCFVRGA